LEEVLKRFGHQGNRAIGVRGNLCIEKEVEQVVKEAIDTFGRVDVLVNNAGGNFTSDGRKPTSLLEDLTEGEWDFIMNNNLKSVFLLTRAVVPYMKKQGYGRIINVSSMLGRVGTPLGTLPYSTAKSGIIGFTRTLAHQLGPMGVIVNAVAPGYIVSGPRLEKIWEERKKTAIGEQIMGSIALRRLGTPQDVADVVTFLASEKASYITGSTIDILGGAYTL
jgi:3-oxoacyl-[acyl-carrier protein] reductase